jgi:hypothetical protein
VQLSVQIPVAKLGQKNLRATLPMAAVVIEAPAVAIAPRAVTPIAVQLAGKFLPMQVYKKTCQQPCFLSQMILFDQRNPF